MTSHVCTFEYTNAHCTCLRLASSKKFWRAYRSISNHTIVGFKGCMCGPEEESRSLAVYERTNVRERANIAP
jgi:hypothetical protein